VDQGQYLGDWVMVQEQRLKGTVEQLVGIIRDIQLRRGTGMLMARRGTGALAEEGSISFVNGQVKEAKASHRMGTPALNYLSTWKRCFYSFVSPIIATRASQPPARPTQEPALRPSEPLSKTHSDTPSSRIPALRGIEKRHLSRAHRHIFLLIDGKRSLGDLQRVTGRNSEEISRLLRDLEQAGLICIFTPNVYRKTVLAK